MDLRKTAGQILSNVGGKSNINTIQNCMTRLRLTLKDESQVQEAALKAMPEVKGLVKAGGQYQIIIGTDVAQLCNEVKQQADYVQEDGKEDKQASASGMKWYERILDVLSGSMIPLIGVVIGAGMILAIVTLLQTIGLLSESSGTYQFFSGIGNTGLYFLPIFVGFTSARKLNANPFIGMFLGATLIYPGLMDLVAAEEGLLLFGIKLSNFVYSSTVIPVILAVWFMSYVEKFAKKICPKIIESFGVSTIVILISVPITYLIIGPIGGLITNGLTSVILFLSQYAGFLTIAIIAALMPILVMSGLHMSLIPIMITIMASTGFDPIVSPAFMCYNIAAAGAAFAVGVKSKDAEFKQLGFSAGVSGILGVTEPSLFGVLLVLKRPLITTMAACAISGVVAGFVNYVAYVPMPQSLLSIPASLDAGTNVISAIIVIAVSFASSFILTYLWGVKETSI